MAQKLKCTKHGEQFFFLRVEVQADSIPKGVAIEVPAIPLYCFACFAEMMIRNGVCALYQSEIEKPEENWIPEDLGEQKK